jgi:hypothetical protein
MAGRPLRAIALPTDARSPLRVQRLSVTIRRNINIPELRA